MPQFFLEWRIPFFIFTFASGIYYAGNEWGLYTMFFAFLWLCLLGLGYIPGDYDTGTNQDSAIFFNNFLHQFLLEKWYPIALFIISLFLVILDCEYEWYEVLDYNYSSVSTKGVLQGIGFKYSFYTMVGSILWLFCISIYHSTQKNRTAGKPLLSIFVLFIITAGIFCLYILVYLLRIVASIGNSIQNDL